MEKFTRRFGDSLNLTRESEVRNMIQCIPHGICSWDYTLQGHGHRAFIHLGLISEQGTIQADSAEYVVHKHGMLSGRWTLQQGQNEIAAAHKTSPFTRSFDLHMATDAFQLEPESVIGRGFRLSQHGRLVATYLPVHLFTRRAVIELHSTDYDFVLVAFGFWLVVLTWRRAANSS